MSDKRVDLAAALRAAGLTEKSDELLREVLRDKGIATPPAPADDERAARNDAFRAELGLPPRTTPLPKLRKRAGIGRARRKVAELLTAAGFPVEPGEIQCVKGWHRAIHKERDDTTVTWEAHCHRPKTVTIEGTPHTISQHVHLFSWCRLTDCARGLSVDPLHGEAQQCVTAKESK